MGSVHARNRPKLYQKKWSARAARRFSSFFEQHRVLRLSRRTTFRSARFGRSNQVVVTVPLRHPALRKM